MSDYKDITEDHFKALLSEFAKSVKKAHNAWKDVAFKAARRDLMVIVGKVKAFTKDLRTMETGKERATLKSICANDCELIVTAHQLVDSAKDLHDKRELEVDAQVTACEDELEILKSVLDDIEEGLRARFERALKARQRQDNANSIVGVESATAEDQAEPRIVELRRAVSNSKTPADRMQLLKQLDDCETRSEAEVVVEQLFKGYGGKDIRHCHIEGVALQECIKDLAQHVEEEDAERRARFGGIRMVPKGEQLKEWVRQSIDPDDSDSISFDEAMEGFRRVVNDIEGFEEMKTKTSKMEEEAVRRRSSTMSATLSGQSTSSA